jgi:hypothetical protein
LRECKEHAERCELKTYHYYKRLSAKRKRGCDKKAVKKDRIEDLVVRETIETVLRYCNRNSAKRKRGCDKKAVKKDWIEDLVACETVEMVLQDSVIRDIAKMVVAHLGREDSAIAVLRKQLDETEKGLQNIADAIQAGLLTPTTKQRFEDLEATKAELEIKPLQNELEHSIITEGQVIYWLNRFKGGDVNAPEDRQAVIDALVSAVYVYDDRIVLTFNSGNVTKTISRDDFQVSDLAKCSPPQIRQTRTRPRCSRLCLIAQIAVRSGTSIKSFI